MNAPWLEEPDHVEFEAHGFPCVINRVKQLGHLCGYVGVPSGHPLSGKDYDDASVDVHGGLTYSDDHAPGSDITGKWWFGFDCAHSGDLVPYVPAMNGTYRDVAFVRKQCEYLADQLAKATS